MAKDIKYKEELVKDIRVDFEKRKDNRRSLEAKWLLNLNFMLGNQFSSISPTGEILDDVKNYHWQERKVYNHIAPIIESRLSKFQRIKPSVVVRPASSDDCDLNTAKLCTRLIDATLQDNNYNKLSAFANYWSEITGSVFFKVVWENNDNGGEIKINACSPYEIYPDSLATKDVENCVSIIHAKAYPVTLVEDTYNVKLCGNDVSVLNLDKGNMSSSNQKNCYDILSDHVTVIERYTAPDTAFPHGRLSIIADDVLLYDGELPFKIGNSGKRGFPFIRQTAISVPTSFFGMSIIERIIPIQKAFNDVKNRKHEFLNRLALGIVAVEEGSVDTDDLQDEGLTPGKVIVYRQGSVPPRLLDSGNVPSAFREEEQSLLNEFIAVSGVSDFMSNSRAISSSVSGIALQLLIEQDDTRLTTSADSIKEGVRLLSKYCIRLYRQFSETKKFKKIAGENGIIETISFKSSDLMSDDVIIASENEMADTPATRKNVVIELLKLGLLSDENGKLSNRNKIKILEIMGFGNWESARNFEEQHIKKALIENIDFECTKIVEIEEVDDHGLHIEEHSALIIQGNKRLTDDQKNEINNHIRDHKMIRDKLIQIEKLNFMEESINGN